MAGAIGAFPPFRHCCIWLCDYFSYVCHSQKVGGSKKSSDRFPVTRLALRLLALRFAQGGSLVPALIRARYARPVPRGAVTRSAPAVAPCREMKRATGAGYSFFGGPRYPFDYAQGGRNGRTSHNGALCVRSPFARRPRPAC